MEAGTPGLIFVKSFGCQGGLWMLSAHQVVDASSPQLGEAADAGHW